MILVHCALRWREVLERWNILSNEINRKWPFARDAELKLP
jgi:hypothetical protein